MKLKTTIFCLSALSLLFVSVDAFGQNQIGLDLSQHRSKELKRADLQKRNYNYAVEVNGILYSGYTLLGMTTKVLGNMEIEQGDFTVGSTLYEGKIQITTKEIEKEYLLTLDQWAQQNVTFEGNLIFILNGVVINAQPKTVLLNSAYLLDYEVIFLDQVKIGNPLAIVKIRTKTKENLRQSTSTRIR